MSTNESNGADSRPIWERNKIPMDQLLDDMDDLTFDEDSFNQDPAAGKLPSASVDVVSSNFRTESSIGSGSSDRLRSYQPDDSDNAASSTGLRSSSSLSGSETDGSKLRSAMSFDTSVATSASSYEASQTAADDDDEFLAFEKELENAPNPFKPFSSTLSSLSTESTSTKTEEADKKEDSDKPAKSVLGLGSLSFGKKKTESEPAKEVETKVETAVEKAEEKVEEVAEKAANKAAEVKEEVKEEIKEEVKEVKEEVKEEPKKPKVKVHDWEKENEPKVFREIINKPDNLEVLNGGTAATPSWAKPIDHNKPVVNDEGEAAEDFDDSDLPIWERKKTNAVWGATGSGIPSAMPKAVPPQMPASYGNTVNKSNGDIFEIPELDKVPKMSDSKTAAKPASKAGTKTGAKAGSKGRAKSKKDEDEELIKADGPLSGPALGGGSTGGPTLGGGLGGGVSSGSGEKLSSGGKSSSINNSAMWNIISKQKTVNDVPETAEAPAWAKKPAPAQKNNAFSRPKTLNVEPEDVKEAPAASAEPSPSPLQRKAAQAKAQPKPKAPESVPIWERNDNNTPVWASNGTSNSQTNFMNMYVRPSEAAAMAENSDPSSGSGVVGGSLGSGSALGGGLSSGLGGLGGLGGGLSESSGSVYDYDSDKLPGSESGLASSQMGLGGTTLSSSSNNGFGGDKLPGSVPAEPEEVKAPEPAPAAEPKSIFTSGGKPVNKAPDRATAAANVKAAAAANAARDAARKAAAQNGGASESSSPLPSLWGKGGMNRGSVKDIVNKAEPSATAPAAKQPAAPSATPFSTAGMSSAERNAARAAAAAERQKASREAAAAKNEATQQATPGVSAFGRPIATPAATALAPEAPAAQPSPAAAAFLSQPSAQQSQQLHVPESEPSASSSNRPNYAMIMQQRSATASASPAAAAFMNQQSQAPAAPAASQRQVPIWERQEESTPIWASNGTPQQMPRSAFTGAPAQQPQPSAPQPEPQHEPVTGANRPNYAMFMQQQTQPQEAEPEQDMSNVPIWERDMNKSNPFRP